jgi:uncharacterized protein (TIGR02452 family)
MRILLNSLNEIYSNGYKEIYVFKQSNHFIIDQTIRFNIRGKYSILTKGKEKRLLVLKAVAIVFFTLGLGFFSTEVLENFKGRRVDVIYIKSNFGSSSISPESGQPLACPLIVPISYQPKSNENVYQFRARIFQDTLKATESGYITENQTIVKIDNNPMLKETETYNQLPVLNPTGINDKTCFSVIPEDTFQVLLKRRAEGANPVGINMANRYHPGGGVKQGCPAQEEALCRRSNHFLGLKAQPYPIPEMGGIYCPHVQVFRKDDSCGFAFMENPQEVALVAVAAYDLRPGSSDRRDLGLPPYGLIGQDVLKNCSNFMNGTRNKVANMLRMMTCKGHTHIVLGALGCGAFENPPGLISNIFYEIFNTDEFKNRFERVDFAILTMTPKDQNNVDTFSTICEALNK